MSSNKESTRDHSGASGSGSAEELPGKLTIREAGLEDLDLLMQWRMETIHSVFSIPEGQPLAQLEQENLAYYRSALPAGEHVACFASLEETIVGCGGMCLSRELPSPDNPNGQCAFVMNIYVRSAYRTRGIGRSVVCWLARRARELGIPKIYLESTIDAHDLYQSLGFRDMLGMMKLDSDQH